MKWYSICLLLMQSHALAQSSAIPDRREFPVNDKINPCVNFYEHACSKVNESFKLRDDRSKHSFSFNDSSERLLEAKKKFMAELISRKKHTKRSQELKDFYSACMDESASVADEQNFVKQVLAEVSKLESNEEFSRFVSKNIDQARLSFVGFSSVPNQRDPDWNDLIFYSSLMSLPERSYYQDQQVVADLTDFIEMFFVTLQVKDAKQRAKWVVDFEKEFAQTYPLPEEIRMLISSQEKTTKEDLIKNYPHLHLSEFLKKIPKRTEIRDFTPANYKFLNDALAKSPMEQLKSVYLFHELSRYMDDAYPALYKKGFEFNNKHLGGPKVRPSRDERCTTTVKRRFDKEIDAELLPILFPDFPRDDFVKLVEKVRASLIAGLQSNKWLSKEGKAAAIKKMQSAELMVVAPLNDEEWDFAPEHDYSPKHPMKNILDYRFLETQKAITELSEKRKKRRCGMGPLTVNAYYHPMNNQFVMPIGILQYPFYDPKLPPEVNLGAIGAVIGHELGHGIDDSGSKYDYEGKLNQWMTDEDLKNFKQRGQALVKQFDEIGHNGTLTLGENIGDLVGVTSAYRAAFPDNKGSAEMKKSFFLQYARAWCQVIRPKFVETLLKTDPHSLGIARTNEQVKHQKGFAEAFACKEGDPMVLPDAKRTEIW